MSRLPHPGVGALVAGVAMAVSMLVVHPSEATAQSLGDRIHAIDGASVFRVPVAADVRVCENGIRRGDHWHMRWNEGRNEVDDCGPGPAELRAVVRNGRLAELDIGRPGGGPADARDLGTPDPAEAAAFLAGTPWRSVDEDPVGVAWMTLRIAASAPGIDPVVARAVRDRELPAEIRSAVLFWAGQLAGDRVTALFEAVAVDDLESQGVREQAVFALSQLPPSASIPALMEIAETAPHAETRRTALFWLSQIDRPEVSEFFARLVLGGDGGG